MSASAAPTVMALTKTGTGTVIKYLTVSTRKG